MNALVVSAANDGAADHENRADRNTTTVGKSSFRLLNGRFQKRVSHVKTISQRYCADAIQIAGAGAGPQDGFTQYPPAPYGRPRWGDYGAAVVDGSSIWVANEYIGQVCTLEQYRADPTCGNTRAPLGNWALALHSFRLSR